MRKTLPLILTLLFSLSFTSNAWWWSSDDDAKDDQIQQLQAQVAEQAHENQQMVLAIIILSTGIVGALVVGAAIGSKARKASQEVQQ